MVQLTFKQYLAEGQAEQQNFARAHDAVHPSKKKSFEKAYRHMRDVKKLPHATAMTYALNLHREDIDADVFDMLAEGPVTAALIGVGLGIAAGVRGSKAAAKDNYNAGDSFKHPLKMAGQYAKNFGRGIVGLKPKSYKEEVELTEISDELKAKALRKTNKVLKFGELVKKHRDGERVSLIGKAPSQTAGPNKGMLNLIRQKGTNPHEKLTAFRDTLKSQLTKEEVDLDEGWVTTPATPHKGPMKRGETYYTHDFTTKVNDPKNRQTCGVTYLRTSDGDKTSGKVIPKGHHLVKFQERSAVTKNTGTSLHWIHPDHIFKDYDRADPQSKYTKDA